VAELRQISQIYAVIWLFHHILQNFFLRSLHFRCRLWMCVCFVRRSI